MLETLFFKLLEISIQASFFILAIIFIRRCFKRLPKRYVCILWGLVALRLLLPVHITSSFSLVPDLSRVQTWAELEVTLSQNATDNTITSNAEQTSPAAPGDISTNAPSAGNVNMATPDHGNMSVDTTPQTGNISAAEGLPQDDISFTDIPAATDNNALTSTESKASSTLNIPLLLSILWCAGMSILLGYGIISYLCTKLQLHEAVHDTDNIWFCAGIPSPFVMGYVKPRIYIPFSVENALLPYIIAHEKSHIAHFDHLGKLFGYILLCVYWFNPFIWAAYVLYCKDLELACDERVINKLGDSERKPYSQALLTCSVANKALLQSPLAFSEVAIKERIINILNYKKPGFWGVVLAIAVCVIAGMCFMTSPKEQPFAIPGTLPEETALETLRQLGQTYWSERLSEEQNYFINNHELAYYTTSSSEDFAFTKEKQDITFYYYKIEPDCPTTIYRTVFSSEKTENGIYISEQQNLVSNHAEIIPYNDPDEVIAIYSFEDDTQTALQMDRFYSTSTVWYPHSPHAEVIAETIAEARKTQEYIYQATLADLEYVLDTYHYGSSTDISPLPETFSSDVFYILDENYEHNIILYGLVNSNAMLIKDGDHLIPVIRNWLGEHGLAAQLSKGDYDSDGVEEYSLHENTNYDLYTEASNITIIEPTTSGIEIYPFYRSDISQQLDRITYEYDADAHAIQIDTGYQQATLDVSMYEKEFETTYRQLIWGEYYEFEEHDGQWWFTAKAGIYNESTSLPTYKCGAIFTAPVYYSGGHTFELGDISITLVNDRLNQRITTAERERYADQLAAFPGTCSFDKTGQLVVSVGTFDSECIVTTNSSGETVYHWTERTLKNYPLEIVNGVVQDVPARLVTEEDLLAYDFGADLITISYQILPYGTRQYILRDNGILHVNVGNENEECISFQYLTFEISEDGTTSSLSSTGMGYYLLQSNDTSSLNAFRADFTGESHLLPSDTLQLPWEWLITMNGEVYDKPQITTKDVPTIEHRSDYEYLLSHNIYNRYNDFYAAEIRKNGTYYTEFRYQDGTDDIILLTDIDEKLVSITVNGQEKELPEQTLRIFSGPTSSYSVPYYMDFTGDDKKEFMVCYGGGGTGVWDNDCIIFNLDTMEQLTFDKNILDITSQLQVTLEEFVPEEGDLVYRLEYNGQSGVSEMGFSQEQERHAAMLKPDVTLEEANEYFGYTPDEETHNISYNPEKECFEMEIWIWANNTYPAQYIGALHADYIWDANVGQFIIDLDTVTLETY